MDVPNKSLLTSCKITEEALNQMDSDFVWKNPFSFYRDSFVRVAHDGFFINAVELDDNYSVSIRWWG